MGPTLHKKKAEAEQAKKEAPAEDSGSPIGKWVQIIWLESVAGSTPSSGPWLVFSINMPWVGLEMIDPNGGHHVVYAPYTAIRDMEITEEPK